VKITDRPVDQCGPVINYSSSRRRGRHIASNLTPRRVLLLRPVAPSAVRGIQQCCYTPVYPSFCPFHAQRILSIKV